MALGSKGLALPARRASKCGYCLDEMPRGHRRVHASDPVCRRTAHRCAMGRAGRTDDRSRRRRLRARRSVSSARCLHAAGARGRGGGGLQPGRDAPARRDATRQHARSRAADDTRGRRRLRDCDVRAGAAATSRVGRAWSPTSPRLTAGTFAPPRAAASMPRSQSPPRTTSAAAPRRMQRRLRAGFASRRRRAMSARNT